MSDADTLRQAIDSICARLEKRPHILIVEDEVASRDLFATWFKRICFAVTTVGTVQEAINALVSNRSIDVVWLDLRLNSGSGLDVLKWANSNQVKTPFIIVTGLYTPEKEAECISHGARAVVQKPKDLSELKEIAERFKIA